MTDGRRYSPEEIQHYLIIGIGAQLPISTVGFILLGINICQAIFYFRNLARRDHLLTKTWAAAIGTLTLASVLYITYVIWLDSIDDFVVSAANLSEASGNLVAMYSAVIMLVQMFWLSCIKKLLYTKPRLSCFIIIPIALASSSSFILSIAVAVISRLRPGIGGSWPTKEISVLVRCALGIHLSADIAVLIVITSQLAILKRSSGDLKTTITKLSWILCLLTFASTVMIVGELYINLPQSNTFDGALPITITFAPLIPNIYGGSFFAVLNAREDLFSKKRISQRRSDDSSSRGLIPGLKFTIDLPENRNISSSSQHSSLSEPAMTFISMRQRSVERELQAI